MALRLLRRLSYLWHQRQIHADLAEELEFHREMKERELEGRGLDSQAASRKARRELGSIALAGDSARDVWIEPWVQSIAQDVRFALHLLVKDRRFVLAAAFALALGIAANVTVYTFVNAVLIRQLPFDEADRLMFLVGQDVRGRTLGVSYLDYGDWREAATTFDDMAASVETPMNVSDEGRAPERFQGSYISANAFRLLRRVPLLGRDFRPDDEAPGTSPVVILAYGTWRTRYGGDPAVIGRTIRVNEIPSIVVGVMPDRFNFPFNTDLWQPLTLLRQGAPPISIEKAGRDARWLTTVFGRLAPTTSVAQAQAELDTVAGRLTKEYPDTNGDTAVKITPMAEAYNGGLRPMLLTLLGAVGFVLLIACVNVAIMSLARSADRVDEIAIRASLGATRWRIVRQLLLESLLLGMLAGGIGWGLSLYGVKIFSVVLTGPSHLAPYWLDWPLDGGVYAFLVAITLAATALFGLVPALQISTTSVNDVLKQGGRGGTGGVRMRQWTSGLLVAELALTLVLLAGAGLMLRSFLALYRSGLVIDTADLVTMRLAMPVDKYQTAEQRKEFFEQLNQRLASMPTFSSVTIASDIPFVSLSGAVRQLTIDGRTSIAGETPPIVAHVHVGAAYFETLGLRLVKGRPFTDRDSAPGEEGAIVNQRFVSMFFADDNPLGRRLRLQNPLVPARAAQLVTIVGVSPTVPRFGSPQLEEAVVFIPVRAETSVHRFASIIVRGGPDLATTTSLLREEVRALDHDLPLYFIQTMDEVLTTARWPHQMFGAIFGVLACIALVLASVGLYAVTAHGIRQRTREIGIRMALSAPTSQVVWLFVRHTMVQLGIGLGIGLCSVVAVGKLMQHWLVQISAHDPITLLSVSLLLIGVAITACVLPAYGAAKADPMVALRCE